MMTPILSSNGVSGKPGVVQFRNITTRGYIGWLKKIVVENGPEFRGRILWADVSIREERSRILLSRTRSKTLTQYFADGLCSSPFWLSVIRLCKRLTRTGGSSCVKPRRASHVSPLCNHERTHRRSDRNPKFRGVLAMVDRHSFASRYGRYSTSAERPTISTMRTRNSVPSASVNRKSSPGMKWTGGCLPSLMAMLDAYR